MVTRRNWLIASLVGAFAMVMGPTVSMSDTLDEVKGGRKLLVGTGILGVKPALWEADGKLVGVEKEFMDYVAGKLGVKYDWVVTEWPTLVPGLKSKRWDVINSGFVKTQERIKGGGILMSRPNYLVYDYIIVLHGSPIKSIDDLKGKIVGTTLGTTDSITAHSLKAQGKIGTVKDFNNYGEPFLALQNKQVDAVLLDQFNYAGKREKMKNLRRVGEPVYYIAKEKWREAEAKTDYRLGGVAMAVRKEDARLLSAINAALNDMEKDGTRKKILQKYGVWEAFQANDNLFK